MKSNIIRIYLLGPPFWWSVLSELDIRKIHKLHYLVTNQDFPRAGNISVRSPYIQMGSNISPCSITCNITEYVYSQRIPNAVPLLTSHIACPCISNKFICSSCGVEHSRHCDQICNSKGGPSTEEHCSESQQRRRIDKASILVRITRLPISMVFTIIFRRCLIFLDRLSSAFTGRPCAIADEE